MNDYPYPLYDEKGKVVCQICGKSFLTISPKHLSSHKIKFADYFKRYPNAPKSNQEFAARSKFGREHTIFKDQEEKEPVVADDLTLLIEQEPEVDELPIQREAEKVMKADPIQATKNRIKNHLGLLFANVEQDYLIREYGPNDKVLKFEFITDFADPVLKVVFQFPDTFWHNRDLLVDLNKNLKLTEYGWKIIEIPGNSPTLEKIDEVLKESY